EVEWSGVAVLLIGDTHNVALWHQAQAFTSGEHTTLRRSAEGNEAAFWSAAIDRRFFRLKSGDQSPHSKTGPQPLAATPLVTPALRGTRSARGAGPQAPRAW